MFAVPDLSLKCDDYINMINWLKVVVTEPPTARKFPDKIFLRNIESRECSILQNFPAHSPAGVRAINLLSGASVKVCNYESIEEFIRSSINSFGQFP